MVEDFIKTVNMNDDSDCRGGLFLPGGFATVIVCVVIAVVVYFSK